MRNDESIIKKSYNNGCKSMAQKNANNKFFEKNKRSG